ncbi:MAG: esterase family protein [Muribaculaceae bacterium]|nr:esterase family protein [Muribaculaceae bacterium]
MKKTIALLLALGAALTASAFRMDTISVPTRYLDRPEGVQVVVPDTPDGGRCPVVYLLNGHGGNHLQWTSTQPRLGELADQYGFIFVLPDGRNSWYWDAPAKPAMQMESFITKDLVPYIDSHYPTIADRRKRAITGFSMGGHGSLWLATRHPDIFGSAGSMSGGVNIIPFPKNWNMPDALGPYADNKDVWEAHTVINLVPTMKDAGVNYIFDCGVDDFFAKVNNDLHSAMVEAKVPHDYISRPGAHTHQYWANALLYHLLFFDTKFNQEN